MKLTLIQEIIINCHGGLPTNFATLVYNVGKHLGRAPAFRRIEDLEPNMIRNAVDELVDIGIFDKKTWQDKELLIITEPQIIVNKRLSK